MRPQLRSGTNFMNERLDTTFRNGHIGTQFRLESRLMTNAGGEKLQAYQLMVILDREGDVSRCNSLAFAFKSHIAC